jgi:hypothetical protein
MVEVACSEMADPEMLDPEAGILADASGGAALICATDNVAENPAKTRSANKPLENDLILRLDLPPTQIETES